MRNLLSLLLIGAVLLTNAGSIFAANIETLTISIAISHSPDLKVTGSIDFPTTDPIVPGNPKVAPGALTVENAGTGVDLTVTLSEGAVTEGWTSYYQFAESKPLIDSTDWKAAGSVPGEVISHGAANAKKLWFKLVPPDTTKDTSISIELTITAAIS